MTWRGEGAIKKVMSITQFVSLFIPPTAHLFLFFVPDEFRTTTDSNEKKNHHYCIICIVNTEKIEHDSFETVD